MQEIDIQALFFVLLRKIKWILGFALAGAVLFGAYSQFMMPDTYRSGFQMYVSNYTNAEDVVGTSSSSILASQAMVQEYIVVLQNDLVMDKVSGNLKARGYMMTNKEISDVLSLSAEGETAMLNIEVTTTDPKLSRAICHAIADEAPALLQEIMKIGSITVMAPARTGEKVGPAVARNTVLGALLGLVLTCAVVIVLHLMDNTVTDEKNLKKRIDVVVLGTVPSFQQKNKGGNNRAKN